MTVSNFIARTTIEHGGKTILVSTINRVSSAALAHGDMYAETFVVEIDSAERWVSLLCQDEAPEGSTAGHKRMVRWVENGMENGDSEP